MTERQADGMECGHGRSRRWVLGMGGVALAGVVAGRTSAAIPAATPDASPVADIPNAPAFMLLRNIGEVPDRLIGASTDAAGSVVLRTFDDSTGVRREALGPVDLEVPAGATVALAPGEPQLMLVDVQRVLPPNTWYALTLEFARSGTIVVPVNVRWGGAPIIENVNRANRYTSGDLTVIEPWAFPTGQAEIVTPVPVGSPVATPNASAAG
ncbi:MAG: copper chaperone PCu(A)C [Thermomicrobiales bacterium]